MSTNSPLQVSQRDASGAPALDFCSLFNAVPDALLVVLPDAPRFTMVAASDAFLRVVGKSREELIGHGMFEVFPDRTDTADAATMGNLQDSFLRVIATLQPDRMRLRRYEVPRPEGGGREERFCHPVNSPVVGGDGAVRHIIHHLEDVTERTRAENELRKSVERTQAFMTASSDAVYRMSADWSEVNHLHGGSFMAETGDARRTWLEQYVHPEDQAQVAEAIGEAIRTKTPFEMEHRVIRLDGTLGWTFSRVIPLVDVNNDIIEWFGAAGDVTSRKDASDSLLRLTAHSDRQRRLYDAILSATPDLAYVFDLKHRFTYANKALLAVWGKSWEEARGKTCLELGYEPWHAAMHGREIEHVVATKQAIRGEVPFNSTHGRRIYDYIFVPVMNATGQVEAVAGTTRDVTDRKQAEAELRHSEERFRLMADAIPQIVWVTDAEGRAEFFNRQWSEYTGENCASNTAAEVAKRFVHANEQRLTIETFEEARRTETVYVVEHRLRSAADDYRWFLVRAEPYRDPGSGQIVRWFGSSTDIQERKVAEGRQAYLLSLADAIRYLHNPEAIKAAGARALGQHLDVNRAFYAEVDGEDWVVEGGYAHGATSLPPGRYSSDVYGRRVMDTYRAGERLVFSDARTDPQFAPAEREAHVAVEIIGAVGVPLVKEGKLVAILTVHSARARDWTEDDIAVLEETAERTWAAVERAHAETALHQGEERLTVALEAGGGVGTFDWDVPGDRLYCDARFAQLFSVNPDLAASGAPQAEFIGSIHSDDRALFEERLQEACRTGDYGVEYRVVQPDGSARWALARGRCHHNSAGNPTRLLGVVVDITTQVLARKELERVNKELEEFAYVASHDLQEPLRMVSIYSELLANRFGAGDTRAIQYAEFVKQGIKRMEALIRDLLSYSRTVQGEELHTGTADLSSALREAQSVLQNRIEENGAFIYAPPLPEVRGDTQQLAQVFQNLLSNSLKYRKQELAPEIHIAAKRIGDQWEISVRDNGIGFEPQYAERIFGLFKRLHKDAYPGTGLGLAICQRIVERYGGRMWAESKLGAGATFYLTLQSRPAL